MIASLVMAAAIQNMGCDDSSTAWDYGYDGFGGSEGASFYNWGDGISGYGAGDALETYLSGSVLYP